MKYAIISDIHSNFQALIAVLEDLKQFSPDEIISLGDAVGYGGNPNECIELLRKQGVVSIIGNHDRVACGTEEPINFNAVAREAALWTRDTLKAENKKYLAELPERKDYESFIAVHGALSHPDKYILGSLEAKPEFSLMGNKPLCFFGHTHVPAVYKEIGDSPENIESRLELDTDAKYLINPGSVGQPRDRDPRAAYLIYDTKGAVEFRRADYDIERAQRNILESGLPEVLAERLSYGY